MRSLLHQTTLTITAVLVLISCATQTQAAGGPDIRIQGQSLYARSFFTKEKAAEEGLSDLQWFGKVGSATSFATLTYDGKPAYMACTTKDNYKLGFEALVSARTTLKGANEEYRNYVKNPLKPVEVTAGPSRPAGYCFVYRNIGGMHLEQFMEHKNYADRLVILSQIMPQILKGFIYLFNAGIRHVDTDLRKVMIEQNNGQFKTTIFNFDVIRRPQPPPQLLSINTPSVKIGSGSSSSYMCVGFHKALVDYITKSVNLRIVKDPLDITPEKRMKIAQTIQRKVKFADAPVPTRTTLEDATNAYISVLQATTISVNADDCSSFAAALRNMQGQQPRSS